MRLDRLAATSLIRGIVAASALVCAADLRAERLPLKAYTTADGLARDDILRIVRDSRGLLWFCTREGLSRFDGHTFVTYTTAQGLPHRSVRDVVETASGEYWIATGNGLARLNTEARGVSPLFSVFLSDASSGARDIHRLHQDRSGVVWVGTSDGLLRLRPTADRVAFERVDLDLPDTPDGRIVENITEDRDGALWVGTRSAGLYRRSRDGRVDRYTGADGLPSSRVNALLVDSHDNVWVGTSAGLVEFTTTADHRPSVTRVWTRHSGVAGDWVYSLVQDRDGGVWVAADMGITHFESRRDSEPRLVRTYTHANGLPDTTVTALAEDRDGDLWVGTGSAGVQRLARTGLTVYGHTEGLGTPVLGAAFIDRAGTLCAFGNDRLARFGGDRFVRIAPNFGKHITQFAYERRRVALQARDGEVWLATGEGLYRFPSVNRLEDLSRVRPKALYRRAHGLDGDLVLFLYEDRAGDVWIQSDSGFHPVLARWNRRTDSLQTFTGMDGWPANTWLVDAAEDASGNLWLAGTALVRYRAGHFQVVTGIGGLSIANASAVHADASGRLWFATDTAGVIRVDDPSGDARARQYTTSDGLSSNQTFNVTDDRWGRVYVVTGRGVDRLDPSTGSIRHYTLADGVVAGSLAFRDAAGSLWFGSNYELSRLVPARDDSRRTTSVWISGMSIGGVAGHVPELGRVELPHLDLSPDQRQISFDFFGIGGPLRYQYRLEGLNSAWSKETTERTVHYASLAPGRYRFQVRAIDADGNAASEPASVAFNIASPLWMRWWFITLAVATFGTVVYSGYRYRVSRLLEIERMRTRIATDLHDDIGASLSRVSILTAVIRQRLRAADDEVTTLLTDIADSSRSLVDSLRDIVWAIDSRQDRVSDMATRVRQFAGSVFDASGTAWRMEIADVVSRVELDSEQRRHVLLFFKEAIHNVARHAKARSVLLEIDSDHGNVACRVTDDGRGFDVLMTSAAAAARGSRGLANMSARANQLGGELRTQSTPGNGTVLTMTVPLKRHVGWRMNMRWLTRRQIH